MSSSPTHPGRGALLAIAALGLLLAGALANHVWERRAGGDRGRVEQIVHAYLLEHPEVLPEAMNKLRERETSQQVAAAGIALTNPFPGAVLGNPVGRQTLVQFTDYACGYCRRSVADVDALIAENPQLKVVVRELPILTPQSDDAAKMALAAARQGRYAAFHKAMFALGRPDASSIDAAAQVAGLDMAEARKAIADPATQAELTRNLDLAHQLGINGTPSWVVGHHLLAGAVGKDELAAALARASG